VNRKALARTSSQPGKTQTINFFLLNGEFYFVDLPGYGYAKVSKELQAKWGKMIERYLMRSRQLRMIFLLVDIRHEPSAGDKQMYEWVKSNEIPAVIIATKADKINRSQLNKQLAMIRKELGGAKEPIIPFSKETGQGYEEVWKVMEEYLAGNGVELAGNSKKMNSFITGCRICGSSFFVCAHFSGDFYEMSYFFSVIGFFVGIKTAEIHTKQANKHIP
jgi:GTP-binding protein